MFLLIYHCLLTFIQHIVFSRLEDRTNNRWWLRAQWLQWPLLHWIIDRVIQSNSALQSSANIEYVMRRDRRLGHVPIQLLKNLSYSQYYEWHKRDWLWGAYQRNVALIQQVLEIRMKSCFPWYIQMLGILLWLLWPIIDFWFHLLMMQQGAAGYIWWSLMMSTAYDIWKF